MALCAHASTGGVGWEETSRGTHGCGFHAIDAQVGKKHPGRGPEPPLNTNCVQHCAGPWTCVTSPSSLEIWKWELREEIEFIQGSLDNKW